ncbi:hypothetical protein [Kineococcus sp. SYSU DK005]|uniref:hypothetical protein n=1 Tax=Kineococcus sp. SYSU DK005 TaxID=3383126 RepID=UPI003D7E2365
MTVVIPRAIRRGRHLAGVLLAVTSVATIAGVGGLGYWSYTHPSVTAPISAGQSANAAQALQQISGRWVGEVQQAGYGSWTADVTFRSDGAGTFSGEGAFPTLGCRATYNLVRIDRSGIDLIERITEQAPNGQCLDPVYVTLQANPDGTLDYRSTSNSSIEFQGRLTKQG